MDSNRLFYDLIRFDKQGRRVFTIDDMEKITGISNRRSLESYLYREVRKPRPLMTRVAHGVYMNACSTRPMTHVIEEVARTLRRGSHNYVSFESALSEYGRISQIPVGHLTVATTGNPGRFSTSFGVVEFTRVKWNALEITDGVKDLGRPLPFANQTLALNDLKNEDRNLHLLLPDEDLDADQIEMEV